MAYVMPTYPLYLSILDKDDNLSRMRLRNANIREAGETARTLSLQNPWFIVLLDDDGKRHGAFLQGRYIDSSTSDDEMKEMAAHWQEELNDGT